MGVIAVAMITSGLLIRMISRSLSFSILKVIASIKRTFSYPALFSAPPI